MTDSEIASRGLAEKVLLISAQLDSPLRDVLSRNALLTHPRGQGERRDRASQRSSPLAKAGGRFLQRKVELTAGGHVWFGIKTRSGQECLDMT